MKFLSYRAQSQPSVVASNKPHSNCFGKSELRQVGTGFCRSPARRLGKGQAGKGRGQTSTDSLLEIFKKSDFLSDCRYTGNFERKANIFLFQIFFTTFAVSNFPLGCDCATLRVTCREQLLHLQLVPQAPFKISPSDLSCRHVIHPYPDQQKSSRGHCTTLFLPCLGNRQVF